MSGLSGINILCIAKLKRSFFLLSLLISCTMVHEGKWRVSPSCWPTLSHTERERESEHTLTQHKEACRIWGLNPHSWYFLFCFSMPVFTCLSCACSTPGQFFPSPVTTLRKKAQRRQVQEQVCTTTLLWKGRARPHLYPPGRVLIDWITPVKHILTSIIFYYSHRRSLSSLL